MRFPRVDTIPVMGTMYVFRQGKWVEQGSPEDTGFNPDNLNRSHAVIQDSMSPTWHPATGEILESKSAFRRATKAAGCEEYGNDVPKSRDRYQRGDLKESIIRAYDECQKRH